MKRTVRALTVQETGDGQTSWQTSWPDSPTMKHAGQTKEIHVNARDLKSGVYGGLTGGVVFGALMWIMGMLTMVGQPANRLLGP